MRVFGIFHARRRPALLATLLLLLATTFLTNGPAVAGGGASDAAHACQQSGYLALHRSDGSSFANTGDCVSYAAKGGTFASPMPACTVTATTGCLTFDNQTMTVNTNSEGTDTVTVNGAFSFDTTCQPGPEAKGAECYESTFPNNLATGAATYTLRDSSGQVLTTGTLTAANTPGTREGLWMTGFKNADGGATDCPSTDAREVWINVTDSNAPNSSYGLVYAITWLDASGVSGVQLGSVFWYQEDDAASTTVTC